MRCGILTIGDEILIGQVVDTNSAWIAGKLQELGIHVKEILSIGDDPEVILQSLQDFGNRFEIVITTGGLGPTNDDRTVEVYSEYFGAERKMHSPTLKHLTKLYEKYGLPMNEHSRKQAYIPVNATVLHNKLGTAPGLFFNEKETLYTCLPGVPYEMKYLLKEKVFPLLKPHLREEPFAYRTLLTVGEGESKLAERLIHFEKGLENGVQLAYLPHLSKVRLRLSVRGNDREYVDRVLANKASELSGLISDIQYGWDEDTLEGVIGSMLKERNLSLGFAESCTGGHLANQVTSVPGSSDYFKGSIVAYSNEIKVQHLGVQSQTLDKYGAVSEQTVIEMAQGALRYLTVDIAASTSGIAGPGGGTPEKPVGTIWLAVASKDKIRTGKLQLSKNRKLNIEYTSVYVLNMVRKFLTE